MGSPELEAMFRALTDRELATAVYAGRFNHCTADAMHELAWRLEAALERDDEHAAGFADDDSDDALDPETSQGLAERLADLAMQSRALHDQSGTLAHQLSALAGEADSILTAFRAAYPEA